MDAEDKRGCEEELEVEEEGKTMIRIYYAVEKSYFQQKLKRNRIDFHIINVLCKLLYIILNILYMHIN